MGTPKRRIALVLLMTAVVTLTAAQAPLKKSKRSAQRGEAEIRRNVHEVLRVRGDHDLFATAGHVGNKETFTILLERLRADYGEYEPPPVAPRLVSGVICTHAHLAQSMSMITNTDEGLYYPRWITWWEKNRALSQREWVLNGFAAQGLHVADPINKRFALELLGLLGDKRFYVAFNAKRLLRHVSARDRARWITTAASSDNRGQRLGAILALRDIDRAGHEDTLRRLAADSDVEVRDVALSTLNTRLRSSRK